MKRMFGIILGNVLITGTYAFITVPNEIINGGITSFSMILERLFHINLTVFVNLITILLLLFCLFFLGKEFFMGSIFSCGCYLLLFTLFHSMGVSLPLPLPVCVIVAGLVVGTGYYLCINAKSTAISFDIIALILNKKYPKVNIAFTMGLINLLVLLTGFAVFGLRSVLYGIVFTAIQAFTLNFLQKYGKKVLRNRCHSTF